MTKVSGFSRKEPLGNGQPRPWVGNFRVWDWVCQAGSEGYGENLEVRSAFICTICTSAPCPETKHIQITPYEPNCGYNLYAFIYYELISDSTFLMLLYMQECKSKETIKL